MKQILYLIIISTFFFSIQRCNSIEPPDEDKPGRRDYVWTVDTLAVPEGRSVPSWMWGANENDIWAVGASYTNAYAIWHYDGNKWSNYVPDQYIDPRGLWGTSSSNIWTASLGTGSLPAAFWNYNGYKWSKYSDIKLEGYYNVVIQSIAGSAPDNIYAVGFADSIDGQNYTAIVFHFSGSIWERVNIPTIRNSFGQIYYDEVSGNFLIAGITFDTITQYVYTLNYHGLQHIYSTSEGVVLSSIGKKLYSEVNYKLLKYESNTFQLWKDFANTNFVGAVRGRSESDFFTINWDGIGHYNGTDLITIYNKLNNDWFPSGGIVFAKDVFFIWEDSFNTFIVHGRLNN